MDRHPRTAIDRVEVRAPAVAALVARALSRLPEAARRRVLQSAFERAQHAFNRGDLEVVFALFSADSEYVPPPPLHDGSVIRGRQAAMEFWRQVFDRYDENSIENLALDEASPGSFVRRARLHHRSGTTGETIDYSIVQTTYLAGGHVIRQVNVLDGPVARTG
jgi:hypothetical protein